MRKTIIAIATATALVLTPGVATAATQYVAVDAQASCMAGPINDLVQAHDGNVLRYIVSPRHAGEGIPCLAAAQQAGIKVYLTMAFDNTWTIEQAEDYFSQTIPEYAPYAWAIAIGNEQEGPWSGDISNDPGPLPTGLWGRSQECSPTSAQSQVLAHPSRIRVVHRRVRVRKRVYRHHRWRKVKRLVWKRVRVVVPPIYKTVTTHSKSCVPSNVGQDYLAYWNALEPIVAGDAPQALRVFGEASPWGLEFLEQAFAYGRPIGSQALAFHCYNTSAWGSSGLLQVPTVSDFARLEGLPLWCSEMAPTGSGDGIPSWMVPDTPSSWTKQLESVESSSPNLQMVSWYAGMTH